jgi:dolichol-phosphate mannosyltransferase
MLSIVVPGYNEAGNIPRLVAAIREVMGGITLPYEIVYADDASTDNSWGILQRLAAADNRIRALRLAENCGQSAALWAGIRMARGSFIATMDADLQNNPAELPQFLEALKTCDCACGSRRQTRREGDNIIRLISSRIANAVRNKITRETISDSGCGYRVFKRECAENLKFFKGMHRFMPTLFKIEGYTVAEIPVKNHARLSGKSHYGIWNRLFTTINDLFAVRWMQNRMIRYSIAESINLPPNDAEIHTESTPAAVSLI